MLADPLLVNLQISVDILPELGYAVVPDKERLKWFLKYKNVIFRFKTTDPLVSRFIDLANELRIPGGRIMETPLREPKHPHYYSMVTPLEKAGWDTQSFGRCNTKCEDCRYENGLLLCAANASMLSILPTIKRPPPPRLTWPAMKSTEDIKWKAEAVRCMLEHGGQVTVQQAYKWFLREYPILEHGKASYDMKIRYALQRAGYQSQEKATWVLRPRYQNTLLAFVQG